MLRLALACSILLAAGGCVESTAVEPFYTQGSDLDLYASLADLGALLRVEEGCNGSGKVTDRFLERYGRRQSVVRARLEREQGGAALEAAEEIHVHPYCGEPGRSHYWRARYESVLAELERRLLIAPPR
ncbi:MAG TPA: hypothetical protein VFQ67_06710 [Allosphingosinicella sp.]|jgi:hypothetical protein|nr:hypothetical protein [Allosphingosinicella sp.]